MPTGLLDALDRQRSLTRLVPTKHSTLKLCVITKKFNTKPLAIMYLNMHWS